MKINTVFYLLEDVFFGRAIAGYKGAVEAVGATTGADSAVAVGTGKAGIDGQFKYRLAKALKKELLVTVIPVPNPPELSYQLSTINYQLSLRDLHQHLPQQLGGQAHHVIE